MILIYILFVSFLGYYVSKSLMQYSKSWSGVWARGLAISLALAGFNAMRHGMPRCVEYDDPVRGSCIEYEEAKASGDAGETARRTFFGTAAGGTLGMLLLHRNIRKNGNIPF